MDNTGENSSNFREIEDPDLEERSSNDGSTRLRQGESPSIQSLFSKILTTMRQNIIYFFKRFASRERNSYSTLPQNDPKSEDSTSTKKSLYSLNQPGKHLESNSSSTQSNLLSNAIQTDAKEIVSKEVTVHVVNDSNLSGFETVDLSNAPTDNVTQNKKSNAFSFLAQFFSDTENTHTYAQKRNKNHNQKKVKNVIIH